ncbi:flp pilus-assembly TadE/G-like family protein [Corynebacterium godavarianum]|uniref:Flp pilus-assembly TadE/G-like family protein n=3 Tax=Corynebacterium TaxID=1716 RepID=A0ABY3E5C9_9CORY|nr:MULTISPECIES: Rv3654c family TadE-like protein [Corynebacterium]MBL7284962.1 flp pilus-assembly TadE/G-like family protein [Corynebacterium godavarianum]PAJ71274.1 TadE-like protein [Corynebacterium hadale]RMD18640.1 TadE-like protein [Corynebacterium gottingense]TSJ74834.1 flp pilus-assembly TadE/G-like family protein [Corynebacterium godavarianum]TVX78378.1 flp pilus-assembly TadE/G-like family protein [Corynebacterium sp. NML180780]
MGWLRRLRSEEGSATVTSAGIITAVIALALAVAAVGARVVDHHRAQVAADLAAVSGATALYTGAPACEAAERTATLNSAAAELCEVDTGDVTVRARIGRAEATARAGPAEEERPRRSW